MTERRSGAHVAASSRTRTWAVIAAVTAGAAVAALVVVAIIPSGDGDGGGSATGATDEEVGQLYAEDFSDPGSGWPDTTEGGATQGYVAGRYEVRFDETAAPDAFVVATPPSGTVEAGDVRIRVAATILGESRSKRDGFGVTCRSSDRGAYYFIVGTSGGWSIQKLPEGRSTPRTLLDSSDDPIAVPIRRVNRIVAECTGPDGGPVSLFLSVNGVELPRVVDAERVLPAGTVGLTVAGPTEADPAGLAVAFDDLVIEDLSSLASTPA